MDVRLPDGTVVTNVPDGMTQGELLARMGRGRTDEPIAKAVAGGAIEPILHLGTGALATPIAGLAGIGAAAGKAVGLTDKEPGDVVRSVSEAMTYSPRTQGGKDATDVITYPLQKYAEGTDYVGGQVTDVLGPGMGAQAKTVLDVLPMLAGMRGAPKPGSVSGRVGEALQSQRNRAEVRDATLSAGMEEGLKVPPSVVNPSAMNKVVESLAGKAALRQELQQRNQPVVNASAAEELGLPKDTALTPAKLDAYRAKEAKPYEEIANLSPTAKSALEEMKKTRAKANDLWDYWRREGNPEIKEKAQTLSQEAETYHSILEQEALKAGKKELVPQMVEARKKIAQSYDIQRSLNLGNADVSASSLGGALDSGAKMTGKLETIGKFQQAMAPYMGDAAGVTTPGVSALVPMASVGMGMGGAASGAGGWLAGGIPLVGGPARALALSEPYQRLMAQPRHGALNRQPTTAELMIEAIKRMRNQGAVGGGIATAERD